MENKQKFQAALALDLPYSGGRQRLIASRLSDVRGTRIGTPAAVLLLFDHDSHDPALLLTKRTETVETHKGQVAFPGGMVDEVDGVTDQSVVNAALRETEEEVGISRGAVEILGQLPDLCAVTGFRVTPVVGLLTRSRSEVQLKANPHEIADIFWVPLSILINPKIYRLETYDVGDKSYPIHAYYVGERRIWGLTGEIIKNFIERWRAVG